MSVDQANTSTNLGTILIGLLSIFAASYQAANGVECDFKKIGVWTDCGYSNTTSSECSKFGCCYATDAFVANKNLTQKCVRPPESFEWKNGTCNKYNGTICLPYLGNTTLNQDIFFDARYGVNGTESILQKFIQISDISVRESQLCRTLIPTGVCKMMLPHCGKDGRPELSCREDCDQIHRLCSKDIDRFYGALEFYVKEQSIDFSHLNIPTCTDFKYSYEYGVNDTCIFIARLPCFKTLSGVSGTVRPHVTYGRYMPNHNCTWHITVKENQIVKLEFSMLDLEESNDCTNDFIIIRDGLDLNSPVLTRLCGKRLPKVIKSTSNKISINFITNSKIEANGFIVKYTQTAAAEASKTDNTTRIAIGVGVAAGLAIIALVVILVIRARRQKTRKYEQEEAKKDLEMFTNFTTVRDRIRQDSTPNPLIEALARLTPSQKPPHCRLDKVEYVKDLGQGQFGKVFQGRYRIEDGTEEKSVAVKMLKEGSSAETKNSFVQEVTLMSVLQHDNILRLLAVSIEEEPFCMVFEYMVNGDLNAYLRKNDPENTEEVNQVSLTNSILVYMALQIARGMEYLSQKRFVHRDLATRNCLVGEEFIVKIADFGMSRDVYESDYYKVGGAAMLPIRWMPPEALLYGKFTVESDVYSYGILLWEIFTFALQPFFGYSNDEVVKFIKKGVVLPKPELCPQEIYDKIMTKCWFKDPIRRLNFTEIQKRLLGEYDYSEEKVPKMPKKMMKTDPSYSAPPSLKDQPKTQSIQERETRPDEMRRIPSKKENAESSAQYVNLKNENDNRDITIPLGMTNGAFSNPLYKNSALASDFYDTPKSTAVVDDYDDDDDDDAENEITIKVPSNEYRRGISTPEDTYDRPKSHPVNRDFPENSVMVPGEQFVGSDSGGSVNEGHQAEDDCLVSDEKSNIEIEVAKKKYVTSSDADQSSKKSSRSSVTSGEQLTSTLHGT